MEIGHGGGGLKPDRNLSAQVAAVRPPNGIWKSVAPESQSAAGHGRSLSDPEAEPLIDNFNVRHCRCQCPASRDFRRPAKPESCRPDGKTRFASERKKLVAGVADPGPASARPATTQALFSRSQGEAACLQDALGALGTTEPRQGSARCPFDFAHSTLLDACCLGGGINRARPDPAQPAVRFSSSGLFLRKSCSSAMVSPRRFCWRSRIWLS